jgi:hypothetical protein
VINPVPGLDAEQAAEPFADRPVLEVVLDDLNVQPGAIVTRNRGHSRVGFESHDPQTARRGRRGLAGSGPDLEDPIAAAHRQRIDPPLVQMPVAAAQGYALQTRRALFRKPVRAGRLTGLAEDVGD